MVFQDGGGYVDPLDDVRGAIVLDNLIEDGAIPPMIGIFVDPGVFPDIEDPRKRKNRNTEYDAFDSRYADFLVDEMLLAFENSRPSVTTPRRIRPSPWRPGGSAREAPRWSSGRRHPEPG